MIQKPIYLGDGVNLIIDGDQLLLSNHRTGERAIALRPAIFKRLLQEGLKGLGRAQSTTLPLLERLVERTLPSEAFEAAPPPVRTIPLLVVTKSRDEEMNEWEQTLRRKRNASAKPATNSPKPTRPISELA